MPTYYKTCAHCGKPFEKRRTSKFCCPECKRQADMQRRKLYYAAKQEGEKWKPVPYRKEWINPAPWGERYEGDPVYGNMVFL